MAAFAYLIAKTPLGRAQRACEQDMKMASLLGIDVNKTISITFIMGAALAQNPLVVEYKKVERWGGTFPTTFMGGDSAASTLWSLPGQGTPTQPAPAAAPARPTR